MTVKVPNKVTEIGYKARPSLHLSEKQDQDQTDRTASKQNKLALKIIMARETQPQKKLLIKMISVILKRAINGQTAA